MDKKRIVLNDWHVKYADIILNKLLNAITGTQLQILKRF